MPRPLEEQVVVLTGASSGIGREAAGLFGRRGAAVVLAARDEVALKEVAREVELAGGRALAVPTDVADWKQVEALAAAAVGYFGRIDTWVNDAGVSIGGTVEATELAEIERIFRVNVLGTIHGVKAALPHMSAEGGGTIINVGSVAGVRAFPIQAVYSATKHAVKGLTEGLRLELWKKGGDFHVTYIAPAAINTPLFEQARTKFGTQVAPPPPIYDPRIVAESIVFAAEHPRRDIFVGGAAKMFDVMERISPELTDWLLTRNDRIFRDQISDLPPEGPDNLFEPPPAPRTIRGGYGGRTHPTSWYTRIFEWHPVLKPMALGAVALGVAALFSGRNGKSRGPIQRAGKRLKESSGR
jgi:NADP-dependent 3-hydroxy acid dehydrogenase YdfG